MDSRARTVSTIFLLGALVAVVLLWMGPSAERRIAMPSSNAAPTASTSRGELARPDDVGAIREPVGENEGDAQENARWFLRGRVLDQEGRPVATAANVWVVADRNPFGNIGSSPSVAVNNYRGRAFSTDDEGRFDIELPRPGRVLVAPRRSKLWIRYDFLKQSVWVDPPAEGIELRVWRAPFGTLVVRAFDRSTREDLAVFKASFLNRGRFVASRGTERGEIRIEVPVESPAGVSYAVKLLEPEVYDNVFERALGLVDLVEPMEISKEVELPVGETREVRLEVP